MSERILFVDDEERVLRAIRRNLGEDFELLTADGGKEAISLLENVDNIAVIISDLDMPSMNGIELLRIVQKRWPKIIRIMLTGKANLKATIDAVNVDNVYKFLTKPVHQEELKQAIHQGLDHYRLKTLEQDLMEKTLRGSIKILSDVLFIVRPELFGQAEKVKRYAVNMATILTYPKIWEIEIASLLYLVGYISIPDSLLEKYKSGKPLSNEEQSIVTNSAKLSSELVKNIPRLEPIATIIRQSFSDSLPAEQLHPAAKILRVAQSFVEEIDKGREANAIIKKMITEQASKFDHVVLNALQEYTETTQKYVPLEMKLVDLDESMIFAEDIPGKYKTTLIHKGQEVTTSLKNRLLNYARTAGIMETVKVLTKVE